MRINRESFFAAVLGTTLLFTPAISNGQAAAEAPPSAPTQVEGAKLEKFAAAFGQVRDLQQQFARSLEQVESQEEAQSLQQQIQTKMLQAVQGNGLTVDEYNNIVSRLDQDPALRAKVMEMVDG